MVSLFEFRIGVDEMDFSGVRLTFLERLNLKRMKNKARSLPPDSRLIRFNMVEEIIIHKPGYMGEHTGTYVISDRGRDYLIYCSSELRKMLWIPIITAFVTTVITNYILPRLPQILQWLASIPSKISSFLFVSN